MLALRARTQIETPDRTLGEDEPITLGRDLDHVEPAASDDEGPERPTLENKPAAPALRDRQIRYGASVENQTVQLALDEDRSLQAHAGEDDVLEGAAVEDEPVEPLAPDPSAPPGRAADRNAGPKAPLLEIRPHVSLPPARARALRSALPFPASR